MRALHEFADFFIRHFAPERPLAAGMRNLVNNQLDRAAMNLYGESVPLSTRCKALPVILLGIPLGSLTRR